MNRTYLKFIYVQYDHQNTTERELASEVSVASLYIIIRTQFTECIPFQLL